MAKRRGINVNFRQKASSLKALRQTKIFSRIKRGFPYSLYGKFRKTLGFKAKDFKTKTREFKKNLSKIQKKKAKLVKRTK